MATVSDDLRQEGAALLKENNSEDIHKLADRIISVESDNWYGLLLRGIGYALDTDFSQCISNWESCVASVEDEATMAEICPLICEYMSKCILDLPEGQKLDFSKVAALLTEANDKLPESDDEIIVNSVLDKGLAYLSENTVPAPLITYYGYKALVITAFRSYVELPIFKGFFEKLNKIGAAVKEHCGNPKMAEVIDRDVPFANMMIEKIQSIIDSVPAETLEKIEEYWLEHKTDVYVAHVIQAYQMSAAVATAGRFTSKMAGKVMISSCEAFGKAYLSPKV